jgi:dolichol-phosphate mannosyltransferase
MGISYRGRTYAEGKKIGTRDGWRALYCILKYNLHKVPLPLQFLFYALIGGFSALVNLGVFALLAETRISLHLALPIAFLTAAALNYYLCILVLFRHRARWNSLLELAIFGALVAAIGYFDYQSTLFLIAGGLAPWRAKLVATGLGLTLNFAARRFVVFPEPPNPEWKPQSPLAVLPPRQDPKREDRRVREAADQATAADSAL